MNTTWFKMLAFSISSLLTVLRNLWWTLIVYFFFGRFLSGSLLMTTLVFFLEQLPPRSTSTDWQTACKRLYPTTCDILGLLLEPVAALCFAKYCSSGSWHRNSSVRRNWYPSPRSSLPRAQNDIPKNENYDRWSHRSSF